MMQTDMFHYITIMWAQRTSARAYRVRSFNDMVKVNRKDTSDSINVGRHRHSLERKQGQDFKNHFKSHRTEKQSHNFKETK